MPEIRHSDGSVRPGESLTAAASPSLGLAGTELTYVRIDHQVRLQFADVEVIIETPFSLTDNDVELWLDPDQRSGLGPLLALFPDSLEAAEVDADLTLRLSFRRGAVVAVPQDPQYEAWHVEGPGTRLIVCPPAGDGVLAVWR